MVALPSSKSAYTGMVVHKCTSCFAVTNSRFTSGTYEAAEAADCTLIDESGMEALIFGRGGLLRLFIPRVFTAHLPQSQAVGGFNPVVNRQRSHLALPHRRIPDPAPLFQIAYALLFRLYFALPAKRSCLCP